MKLYKAFVRDTETKEMSIIEIAQYNMKTAIRDIKNNGYTIVSGKIKEASEFDRIMSNTDCNPWDWHPRKYKSAT